MFDVGEEHSKSGKISRQIRNDDPLYVELSCYRDRVTGPRAAVGDHDKITRIIASLHCHDTHRMSHMGVSQLDDPVSGLNQVQSESFGKRALNRLLCLSQSELNFSAQKVAWIQPAKNQIRIGDRGPNVTLSITGGAGNRSSALRADFEGSRFVHVSDASSSRSHFKNVNNRQLQGKAMSVLTDGVTVL